jgi:uncharacterized protein YbjQ (UPF0145 family)
MKRLFLKRVTILMGILLLGIVMFGSVAHADQNTYNHPSSGGVRLIAIGFKFFIGFVLIAVGYFKGSKKEKEHFRSIQEREAKYLYLPAVTSNLKTVMAGESMDKITSADMVTGSVVMAADSFKSFLSNMISIVGGNLTPYQSMMDRARREAILRMKADASGADMIVNVRIQSHSIGSPHHDRQAKSGGKAIEVLAYGTALKFRK